MEIEAIYASLLQFCKEQGISVQEDVPQADMDRSLGTSGGGNIRLSETLTLPVSRLWVFLHEVGHELCFWKNEKLKDRWRKALSQVPTVSWYDEEMTLGDLAGTDRNPAFDLLIYPMPTETTHALDDLIERDADTVACLVFKGLKLNVDDVNGELGQIKSRVGIRPTSRRVGPKRAAKELLSFLEKFGGAGGI